MKQTKLFLALITFIASMSVLQAQQEFTEGAWYIQQIELNGNNYNMPDNLEMPYAKLSTVTDMLISEVSATGFMTSITFKNDNSFHLSNFHTFENTCTNNENQVFFQALIDFFQNTLETDFTYTITSYENNLSSKTIDITNANGSIIHATNRPYGIPNNLWLFQKPILKKVVWQGQTFMAPDNEEVSDIHLDLDVENNPTRFNTYVCIMANAFGFVDFAPNGKIIKFREIGIMPAECWGDNTSQFQGAYFSILSQRENYPFHITTTTLPNNTTQIVLQDEDGNQLLFETDIMTVDHYKQLESIQIYPNPATNYLQIACKSINMFPIHLNIYSLQGDVVLTKTLSAKAQQTIDVNDLSSGIYTVVLHSRHTKTARKITIQH